jgi:hypothetical protein
MILVEQIECHLSKDRLKRLIHTMTRDARRRMRVAVSARFRGLTAVSGGAPELDEAEFSGSRSSLSAASDIELAEYVVDVGLDRAHGDD